MFTIQAIQVMLDSTPVGYAYHELLYDKKGVPKDIRLLNFNPAYLNILDIKDTHIKDKTMFELFPNLQDEMPGLLDMLVKTVTLKEHQYFSGFIPSFNRWVNIDFFSPADSYFIAQIIDVTQIIQQEEQIYYLSFHDKLTGLYNRAYFEEELKRLDNDRNFPLAIIMGDVNGLKIINDVFGHLIGDKMLKTIGEILKISCRKGDVISRWGGDEFAIILPNTPASVVKEVIHRITTNCKVQELDLQFVNISLGFAIKDSADISMKEVLVEAENNMYRNKVRDGKKVREMIVSSMIQFLFDGNYEVKHHIDRIRKYSILIAQELNLSKMDEERLLILSDTHDIGKIILPKELLDNEGILDEKELSEMKRHSEAGYRIAKSIPELADVADLILHHHERWDGKGYPHGLRGEEIPYLARIFNVIDTFDALTQEKTYREAMTNREAVNHLITQKGKQFDPEIVEAFLRVL